MVIEVLVKEQIEEGRKLIEKLQLENFPVAAAFWERLPDTGYWQLVIASPLAREKGPIDAYKELRRVWDSLDLRTMTLTDVTILSPTDYSYIRYHMYLPYRRGSNPRDVALDNGYIYFISPDATPIRIENGAKVED
jgi:hypothetical protein